MDIIKRRTLSKNQLIFLIMMIGSIPVFLINLGSVTFIDDEGIRSMVALEMDLSGNYITPTLNGEYYYKKPPLWNWILLSSFKMSGKVNEWTARIPTLLFLYLFCLSIYFFFRKPLGEKQACINALIFLTCGRILFWDSMLALIDICFSWVVFCMFMWIYIFHEKEKWSIMYAGAYLLAALAFLLKALPAVVFLGLTLVAYHLYRGSWRKWFSWQHLIGILVFGLVVGSYFYAYHKVNALPKLFNIFLEESTNRTVINNGIWETIKQVGIFPFEQIYHFLPWSIMVLLLIRKDLIRTVLSHPFIAFCAIVFAANIWIYWFSPAVHPRYLFMLIPLFFAMLTHLYFNYTNPKRKKITEGIVIGFVLIVCLLAWLPLILPQTKHLENLAIKLILIEILLGVLCYFLIKFKSWRWFIFVAVLLVMRLGFDWVVLPIRAYETYGNTVREDARRIGKLMKNENLYIYGYDILGPANSFYITAARNKILYRKQELDPGDFLLVNPKMYPAILDQFTPLDSIGVKPQNITYLIKVPE